MEVHAHTHTPRKKWTHYFWEFLMLFLAVFCGFLAENQREHFVENQREKKYAASLLEDLKKDTADLSADIPFWERYLKTIDTLRTEIQKSGKQRNDLLTYKCARFMRFYNNFAYHDRTIIQLKNSGNFRLIKNSRLSDSLIDYDASIRSVLHDQEMQSNTIWQNLNFLQDQLFNSSCYQFYDGDNVNPLDSAARHSPELIKMRKGKEEVLFEYYNRLEYYRQINEYRYYNNKFLLSHATNLIQMIKKEYHLK
jgi:hypothetical protein